MGFVTAAVYFTGTLYWITRVMAVYGGLQTWVAVLVNAVLIATLALFPAFCAAIVYRFVSTNGPLAVLAAPVVWVATELGPHLHATTGFRGCCSATARSPCCRSRSSRACSACTDVSMLVAAVNAALAVIVGGTARPAALPFRPRPWRSLLLGSRWWGSARLTRNELTQTGEQIRVGLIQGNVDQAEKWDPGHASSIFSDHLRMTRQALQTGRSS